MGCEMKPLRDYDLVLTGRGDTRRLWAERFLDVGRPRRSAEAWAMRNALASVLATRIAAANNGEAIDMSRCGVAPGDSQYRQIIRTALKSERMVINSRLFYRGTQVDIPALRGINPNHVIANTLLYVPKISQPVA
jgi:hypothetical protein